MSPTRLNWRWRLQVATARGSHKPRLLSERICFATSRKISPGMAKADRGMGMTAAPRAIRRPRARSSAGTRRSRTAFCSRSTSPGDPRSPGRALRRALHHRRYHESLQNLTPADVYFGRGQTILLQRERIKRDTIKLRRLQHQLKAAFQSLHPNEPEPPFQTPPFVLKHLKTDNRKKPADLLGRPRYGAMYSSIFSDAAGFPQQEILHNEFASRQEGPPQARHVIPRSADCGPASTLTMW